MKKKLKIVGLIAAILLAYEILGACLPFVHVKKVGKSFADSLDTSEFYGEGNGKDWAKIVETNQEALTCRLDMFEEAEESIVISTFDIRPGKSTSDTFASLLAAADRGVKVQILVDGLYGMLHMDGELLFQAAGSHPNMEIRYYNKPNLLKPWTFNGRMHDKYVIVDNKLLLMGGRNMFDYFVGEYPDKSKGYDREVLLYHPGGEPETDSQTGNVILDVREYFQDIWELKYCKTVFDKMPGSNAQREQMRGKLEKRYVTYKEERGITAGIDWTREMVPVEKATFVTNPTNIGPKEPYVWHTMLRLMEQAGKRVVIQTPYAVFSQDMYRGMEALVNKVGNVDMLINSVAVGDNFMASSDYTHNKGKVIDTGVSIFEYFGDHSCHAKSIVIDDDLSVVGSYNFDMRSTYVDTETMLVIHGKEFNKLLEGYMEELRGDSLEVYGAEEYVPKDGVERKEIPWKKRCLFAVTSRLIQIVRFLA